MPIPLSSQQSRPSIKFQQPGIGAELCIVGQRVMPKMEMGGQRQAVTRDGKPRNQLVLTGILVSTNGAVTGPEGQTRPLQVGEIVDYYADGGNWFQFIEAERAMQSAGMTPQVGDVVVVHFSHTEPSQMPGGNPKKVRPCTLRRARPDEAHFVNQAESLYYSLGFDRPLDAPAPIALQQQPGPFDGGQQGYPQQAPAPVAPYGQQAPAPAPMAPQQPYGQQAPTQAPQQPVQPYAPQPGPGF
jgi:hypothetical protein